MEMEFLRKPRTLKKGISRNNLTQRKFNFSNLRVVKCCQARPRVYQNQIHCIILQRSSAVKGSDFHWFLSFFISHLILQRPVWTVVKKIHKLNLTYRNNLFDFTDFLNSTTFLHFPLKLQSSNYHDFKYLFVGVIVYLPIFFP